MYVDGISIPTSYPHYTDVLEMRRKSCDIPETDANLVPIAEETLEQWRLLYNENMRNIPAAFFMSVGRAQEILRNGTGYFVNYKNELFGIGVADKNRIDCIISLIPGAGRDVLCALCKVLTGDEIVLEVASTNERAVSFYEKMGFSVTSDEFLEENVPHVIMEMEI